MLKDQHTYRDCRGNPVSIVGRTKNHEDFVYSRQGNWYLRSTGQFLLYNPKTGEHAPHSRVIPQDIDLAIEPTPFEGDAS